jgi:hypothetical protein
MNSNIPENTPLQAARLSNGRCQAIIDPLRASEQSGFRGLVSLCASCLARHSPQSEVENLAELSKLSASYRSWDAHQNSEDPIRLPYKAFQKLPLNRWDQYERSDRTSEMTACLLRSIGPTPRMTESSAQSKTLQISEASSSA